MLIENAGDHWLHYGLIRVIKQRIGVDGLISWHLKPWRCIFVQLIVILKGIIILVEPLPTKTYAIWAGDFNYFYGGMASRLYMSAVYIFAAIYPLNLLWSLSKEKNRAKAIRCLHLFHMLKTGVTDELMSSLSDQSFQKLIRNAGILMKILNPLFFISFGYSGILSGIYLYQLDSWDQLPIGLFWSVHYVLGVFGACSVCFVHSLYFACFCHYVCLAIDDIDTEIGNINNKDILKLEEIGKRIGFNGLKGWRNNVKEVDQKALHTLLFRRAKFNNCKLLRLLNARLQLCFAEIRVCDQFYGAHFRVWISCFWFCLVAIFFSAFKVRFIENVANSVAVICLAIAVVVPYLAASMVTARINRTYKLLNRLMLKPMPFSTKWHYLLTIELLASKRNKIGFKVKNWYTLSRFNLLKVHTKTIFQNYYYKLMKYFIFHTCTMSDLSNYIVFKISVVHGFDISLHDARPIRTG